MSDEAQKSFDNLLDIYRKMIAAQIKQNDIQQQLFKPENTNNEGLKIKYANTAIEHNNLSSSYYMKLTQLSDFSLNDLTLMSQQVTSMWNKGKVVIMQLQYQLSQLELKRMKAFDTRDSAKKPNREELEKLNQDIAVLSDKIFPLQNEASAIGALGQCISLKISDKTRDKQTQMAFEIQEKFGPTAFKDFVNNGTVPEGYSHKK